MMMGIFKGYSINCYEKGKEMLITFIKEHRVPISKGLE